MSANRYFHNLTYEVKKAGKRFVTLMHRDGFIVRRRFSKTRKRAEIKGKKWVTDYYNG